MLNPYSLRKRQTMQETFRIYLAYIIEILNEGVLVICTNEGGLKPYVYLANSTEHYCRIGASIYCGISQRSQDVNNRFMAIYNLQFRHKKTTFQLKKKTIVDILKDTIEPQKNLTFTKEILSSNGCFALNMIV